MSRVTLEAAKSWLNVYFTEKDAEIQLMVDAAEAAAEHFLQRPLSELTLPSEDSPPPDNARLLPDVEVGVLTYVEDFWQNRGSVVVGSIVSKNDKAEQILHMHRRCLGV